MMFLATPAIVFAVVFTGALSGVFLQARLPDHHRDTESKAVIQLVMGLIATMAALVLSLLVASAHTFYDTQQTEMQQLSVNVVLLDEILARYGPETQPARLTLRQDVARVIQAISPVEGIGSASIPPGRASAGKAGLFDQVQELAPLTDAQHYDQSEALSLMTAIATTRLLIHQQSNSALPGPLLVVMVAWLTILFVGFGLFARVNITVIAALFFGAVSVAAALFLILEMSHPYSGLMRISAAPLQSVLAQINR